MAAGSSMRRVLRKFFIVTICRKRYVPNKARPLRGVGLQAAKVPAIPPYCFILEKYIKPVNSFPAATPSYT